MAENGTTIPQEATNTEETFAESKGKGKAVEGEQPQAMAEDDDDDDSSDDEEEENQEAAEDDGMEEIDLNNIVDGGRRTRGAVIDFAKAAEENPAEDDEDEDDEDFKPADEDTAMSG